MSTENPGRRKEEERKVNVILTSFILVGTISTNTQQHAPTNSSWETYKNYGDFVKPISIKIRTIEVTHNPF